MSVCPAMPPWWQLPGGLETLSQEDRERIRKGFELFNANRNENGSRFFAKFFERNPEYKNLFPQLRGVALEDIPKHRFILCAHVDRFFYIFDEFMANLYNVEALHSSVYGMLHSKSHQQYRITAKHVQKMLDALLHTVEEVLSEKNQYSKADERSWRKFMACLLNVVNQELSSAA